MSDDRGLLVAEDVAARAAVEGRLVSLEELCSMLYGANVAVIAGGECLDDTLLASTIDNADVLVAADGAANLLLDVGACPHIIVSDFDGGFDALSRCRGSIVVAHFHGDNVWVAADWATRLERIACTVQQPGGQHCAYLPGFTDGDRALMLVVLGGAESVYILGWCTGHRQHPRTKPPYLASGAAKRVKLRVAEYYRRLAQLLCRERLHCRIYTLGGDGSRELA